MYEPLKIGPTWRRGEEGRYVLPKLSLGWHIGWWTGEKLLNPLTAGPWEYTGEQFRWLLWWYAVDEQLRFLHPDGVLQRIKGWGKDPVGASVCGVEFVGPCRPSGKFATAEHEARYGIPAGQPLGVPNPAAWIQTAAVSKDQTRNTMTLFPGLFAKDTLAEYQIDLGKEIIYAHHGAQRIEAVTSSPRALEGGRPTFVLRNETQHWLSNNDGHAMDAVIERNVVKRSDGTSRALSITNAPMPGEDSVAERARDAYDAVQAGRAVDIGMLYDSLEAPPEAPLTAEAAPEVVKLVSGDSPVNVDGIVKSILDVRNPPSRSRRFWYNQLVAAEDAWCTPYGWDANQRDDLELVDGDEVGMFFDGSKSDDATGLSVSRMSDGAVFRIGCWQRPPQAKAWIVPRSDVDAMVDQTFARLKVWGFFADPGTGDDDETGERFWDALIDGWGQRHGSKMLVHATMSGPRRHPVMWDMRATSRLQEFTEATMRTLADIEEQTVPHDGDRLMRSHVLNAKRRPNQFGVSISKEHRESARKIDLAVTMIGARLVRRQILGSKEWQKRQNRATGKGRVIVLV